mmetsp:Transcript_25231/g.75727  ORF Transcript_25231/g.75727 Transcript_25231/m.75727 type:complete len:235 (-) Transcript_25231:117-821(-)
MVASKLIIIALAAGAGLVSGFVAPDDPGSKLLKDPAARDSRRLQTLRDVGEHLYLPELTNCGEKRRLTEPECKEVHDSYFSDIKYTIKSHPNNPKGCYHWSFEGRTDLHNQEEIVFNTHATGSSGQYSTHSICATEPAPTPVPVPAPTFAPSPLPYDEVTCDDDAYHRYDDLTACCEDLKGDALDAFVNTQIAGLGASELLARRELTTALTWQEKWELWEKMGGHMGPDHSESA